MTDAAPMRRRTLAEVRAAGDERWFLPALDRIRSLRSDGDASLHDFLDPARPVFVGRAPGRLDVMGGIADYSGALVLELPLACATTVSVQLHAEAGLRIASRREGRWHHFHFDTEALVSGPQRERAALAAWFREHVADRWAAYLAGVVQYCLAKAGPGAAIGLRLLVDSDVPEGKGVASSAALEVAGMCAVAAALNLMLAPEVIATACQWVENHVVGAPCGIMDQMTSACGRQDRLLQLRCQPGTIEGHVAVPDGLRFFGIDSGLRHAVTGADYETVRTAAFMGYRMIAAAAGLSATPEVGRVRVHDPTWRGYLTNISSAEYAADFERHLPEVLRGAEFLEQFAGITDQVTWVRAERDYPVLAATTHAIREQDRIERFAARLGSPDPLSTAVGLGHLMYAAHASYSACGLGSDGTDRLVELVREAGAAAGLYGAKITGGGSGGTVAVLARSDAEAAVRAIAARYGEETGRTPLIFNASGPGAAETGVLALAPGELATA